MINSDFTKGIITGAIAGAAISFIVNPPDSHHQKMLRKNSNKLMRNIGNMINNII